MKCPNGDKFQSVARVRVLPPLSAPLPAKNQGRVGVEKEDLVRTRGIRGPDLDFRIRKGFGEEVVSKSGR